MKKVGIIGAGPAGCACAYFLKNFVSVTLIDAGSPLKTILPTGGGRCNLAHAEYDFRELAKNYPRGEKFLYSVFSRFSTSDTINFFKDIGVDTYTQEDYRIFPTTDSSKNVREAILKSINNVDIKREEALRIEPENGKIKVITDTNSHYFENLVVAIGGHSTYAILARLGINIIPPMPALTGLVTRDSFNKLAGITLKNCLAEGIKDSLLFTHKGISGPLVYKISSIKARENFPYKLRIDLYPQDISLQDLLNSNPHKQINNLLSEILPKKLVEFILQKINISPDTKCHQINAKQRETILCSIHSFETEAIKTIPDGEVVTAGGVDLKEVNPKTLESKKIKGLYIIGETLDIDGFCGGFNLQNCWSTAFVAAKSISSM